MPPARSVSLGDGWRVAIQSGAAAGLSWVIATEAVGHAAPLSAPVVAVISIGATTAARWRRTLDVVLGVSLGIGLASLLVAGLGRGALLLALVVTAAMLTAGAARGGELLVMQAGIAAILVFAADADSAHAAPARFVDALVGGGSAALVSLFVLPPDPVGLILLRLHILHAELAGVLDDIAGALRHQEAERASAALERARATSELVDALHATRPVAGEIARFVPVRWGTRDRVARLDSAAIPLDHASRNTRVIARAAVSLLAADHALRHDCAAATATLADALRQLDPTQPNTPAGQAHATQAAQSLALLHAKTPSPALGAIAAAAKGIADDLTSVQATLM